MDCFFLDPIIKIIKQNQKNIFNQLSPKTQEFDPETTKKNNQKLLSILDYSPERTDKKYENHCINLDRLYENSRPKSEISSFTKVSIELSPRTTTKSKRINSRITMQYDNSQEKEKEKEKAVTERSSIKNNELEDDKISEFEIKSESSKKSNNKEEEDEDSEEIDDFVPSGPLDLDKNVKNDKNKKNNINFNLKSCFKKKKIEPNFKSRVGKMIKLSNINIFLFNTSDKIEIKYTSLDTIRDLKYKIIQKLKEDNKFCSKINSNSANAYELRVIDDDEEVPDMDFPPLGDMINVYELKPSKFAFLKNPEFCNNSESNNFNLTVFYYYKGCREKKMLKFSSKDNLKAILKYFFENDYLTLKNYDYYYFVEHKEEKNINNAINMNREIEYLSLPHELDLCYKKFIDTPTAMNPNNLAKNSEILKEYLTTKETDNDDNLKVNEDDKRKKRISSFGSSNKKQEFDKVNNKRTSKEKKK